MDKKDERRYAGWAVKVCTGKLGADKVRSWLSLADYRQWDREYLAPARKLKDFRSMYVDLTETLSSLKLSRDKIKSYNEFFGGLSFKGKPGPYEKLLMAISDAEHPLPMFKANIEAFKKDMEKAPAFMRPLFEKNLARYEGYAKEYEELEIAVNEDLDMLNQYAGMQLLELLGII